jgi:hypothetical protein
MTSPVPGQEQQPWETQSRPQEPPREQGSDRNRLVIVSIAAAAVVLLGTVASVWWFSGRSNPPSPAHAAPPVSMPRHTTKPKPDNSPYGVGTCLDEPADPNTGGLELTPVPCAGSSSVLIVNEVVKDYNDCAQGADYVNHGFVLSDEVANVDYCVSLVVPANQCFAFSNDNSKPIARAACGSAANVVRVEAVETAASVTAACTDQQQPQDVWYYQSPNSGQFACVTPLPPTGSEPPTTT